MHADGVFGGEERVLVLTGGVDDGDIVLDTFMGDLLEVGGLHSGVIWFDELVVDKLDDERRLACGACLSSSSSAEGIGRAMTKPAVEGLTNSSRTEHADFAFPHEITGSVARHDYCWRPAGGWLAGGWRRRGRGSIYAWASGRADGRGGGGREGSGRVKKCE